MMRAVRLVLVNAAFLLWLGAGAAQAGRLIEFPNVSEQSKPAQLPGYLARPDAPGPFPAVVVLHGCSGFFSTYAAVADDLKWEGYVALAVDSLGPRGIANACGAGLIEQAVDAHAALNYLVHQPFVDPSRIAVLGYSMGGSSALMDVELGFIEKLLPGRFAAAIAYYPMCQGRSPVVTAPTLILIGAEDDWTPAQACRELAAQPREGGAPLDLTVYPGTYHGFDNPKLTRGVRIFGHFLEYNEPAATDAWAKVLTFLAATLGRPTPANAGVP